MRLGLGSLGCCVGALLSMTSAAWAQGAPPSDSATPAPTDPTPPVAPTPPASPVQPSPPQQPFQQQPGQPYPYPYLQQPYPQQPTQGMQQQPGYDGTDPSFGPGTPLPPARSPGYGPGYGPPPPAPPPHQRPPRCCRAAVRFDPFNLLFRRLSFQGEVALVGPLSIEVEPSYIFGSGADNVKAKGFAIAGDVAFYFTGKAPQGFFIKAQAAYETFRATVTNPDYPKSFGSGRIASPIFGGMIGSSNVFGRDWGFNISGGIGIGVATAGSQAIAAPGKGTAATYVVKFYDKSSSIQLLGSLGLGIGF